MAVHIKDCCKARASMELGHCKQCGAPYCTVCVVSGPTGRFCSPECKAKHENFTQHAQQLDAKSRGATWVRVRQTIAYFVVLAAVIAVVLFAATLFPVPILSDLGWSMRNMLGI